MRHALENFAAIRSEWKLHILVVVYEAHIQKKKKKVNYHLLQLCNFDFEVVYLISSEFLLRRMHIKKQNHKACL